MAFKEFIKSFKVFYDKVYHFFLFFASIAIIVYLFPTQGKFQYEFQKGRPWKHENLFAPFDFPILKSEEQFKHENDSVLKEFKPYFKLDRSLLSNQIETLDKVIQPAFETYLKNNPRAATHFRNKPDLQQKVEDAYSDYAKEILTSIFSRGVVEFSDVLERTKTGYSVVIIDGKLAENRDVSAIFTPRIAFNYIRQQIESDKIEIRKKGLDPAFLIELKISDFVIPNLFYDEKMSEEMKQSLSENILPARGMVQTGQRIVIRGDVVDEKTFLILSSLKKEYETFLGSSTNYVWLLTGEILLVLSAILVLFLFLYNFRREILYSSLKTSFILILVVLMVTISSITIKFNVLSIYLIPFTILPIIIRTFYDSRLALFIHMVTILLIGFLAPNGFEFVFMQFIAGIMAIMSLSSIHRRRQLFITALIVMVSYSMVYLGISLLQEGDINKINLNNFIWFAGNSLLLLSCYPLMFIFEKIFGFLSDITLMELSDTNHPVLRELAEKAPGTFQHSITVANLAEEATIKIGGNPLLVRTGALYHDVGKTFMPQFFIENQNANENPHDKLDPEESARIIISHVTKGVEIARHHKLPQQIIDFIRSHHGTNRVEYFYRTFINRYPNQEVNAEIFTYPGPVPYSRETAVLMMADAVEAASRSLKSISEEALTKLVDDIISQKINNDQFMYASITFKDITTVKDVFKKKLLNIFHSRIEYPGEVISGFNSIAGEPKS